MPPNQCPSLLCRMIRLNKGVTFLPCTGFMKNAYVSGSLPSSHLLLSPQFSFCKVCCPHEEEQMLRNMTENRGQKLERYSRAAMHNHFHVIFFVYINLQLIVWS